MYYIWIMYFFFHYKSEPDNTNFWYMWTNLMESLYWFVNIFCFHTNAID